MDLLAQTLERELIVRRRSPPDLSGAFLAAAPGLADPLRKAGLAIAATMDELATMAGDLPYHGRHHAVDATLAMAALCSEAVRLGMIDRQHAACGVIAMVGHDMLHDGALPGGGVLERRSQAAVALILGRSGIGVADAAMIEAVILATDPDRVVANAARLGAESLPLPQDVLNKLANEADVFGSLLPRLGPMLVRALAEEWRPLGDPALLAVAKPTARLAFLRGVPRFSRPAIAVGLTEALGRGLSAYAEIGGQWGAAATPEAGCAVLDMQADSKADAIYNDALTGWS